MLVALFPAAAKAEWRSLRSEHFRLIGDAAARQLREVALRFEQFRDIVTRVNLWKHVGAAQLAIAVEFVPDGFVP
jgi:hypothetical protein